MLVGELHMHKCQCFSGPYLLCGRHTLYWEDQLDFTREMEVFHMLFERYHAKNWKISIKHQIEIFQFPELSSVGPPCTLYMLTCSITLSKRCVLLYVNSIFRLSLQRVISWDLKTGNLEEVNNTFSLLKDVSFSSFPYLYNEYYLSQEVIEFRCMLRESDNLAFCVANYTQHICLMLHLA